MKSKELKHMGRRVLCYGDSNTYGYDPRSYIGERYPETVRWTALLEKRGWSVINKGQNGRSIPRRRQEIEALARMIHQQGPVITTIMLGSNDLLQDSDISATNCAERMECFLKTLLEQDTPCKLLLIAPPPMVRGAWVSSQTVIETSRCLGTHYRMVAQKLGVDFVDTKDWNIDLSHDGVHFSERGHLIFLAKSAVYYPNYQVIPYDS